MIDHEGSVSTPSFHQRMVDNDHRTQPDITMVPEDAELAAAVEHNHEMTAVEQTPVDITDHDSRHIGMMMRNDNDVESIVINKEINACNHNDAVYVIVEAILDKDEYGHSDASNNSKGNKKVREHRDIPGKNNIISQQKQPGVVHVVASNKMNDVLSSSSTRSHHDGDDAVNQKQQQSCKTYQQDSVHDTVLSHPSHSPSRHKDVDPELIKKSYDHIDLKSGGESVSDPCIVQLKDDPYVSNSGNTANLPSAAANSNYNGKGNKVPYDTTTGIMPGAVRVAACHRPRSDFDSQSSNVSDGTHLDNYHELESSARNEDVYHAELSPMELLEKVEAVPWEDPPVHNASKRNSENERRRLPVKQGLVKLLLLLVLFLLVIAATVIIAMWCGNGNCRLKTTNTAATTTGSSSNNNTQQNVITYKPFETKQELVDAIDQLLSGHNRTSVEGTYGNISLWNVSQIEDFSYLFSPFSGHLLNTKFNEDISRWDVSSASNMSYMFYGAQDFRGDISKWNVSQVNYIQHFMSEAYKFNSNLSKWDTSQFRNTSYMFYDAINFSGIGLENWNVANVYDMTGMFSSSFACYFTKNELSYCTNVSNFDGNLSNWEVSNVRYMAEMFRDATSFRGVGLDNWNTSKVENMNSMFALATSFDANLSLWDMSNVNDTSSMFSVAKSFQGAGVENWNTSKIETMNSMFNMATSFDANLSLWDMSNVNDASWMLYLASSFQGVGVENWNTSKVETMNGMFQLATSFDARLGKWNTSKVENMNAMFNTATSFDANLSLWDMSNVMDTSSMFSAASSFQGVGVENWNTSKIEMMYNMFASATSFDANLSSWDMSNVKATLGMFSAASAFQGVGVENWNTSKIETMSLMFATATFFDANLSSWDVSRVSDMSFMFWNASSFHGEGINEWNTISVQYTRGTFAHATSFDTNLSNWDVSNVVDMTGMFQNAIAFHGDGLDLWNVSQVNQTAYMFASDISFNADLSRWDISNLENATGMFENATSFEGVLWWNDTFANM